jgi:hypothetical protein
MYGYIYRLKLDLKNELRVNSVKVEGPRCPFWQLDENPGKIKEPYCILISLFFKKKLEAKDFCYKI